MMKKTALAVAISLVMGIQSTVSLAESVAMQQQQPAVAPASKDFSQEELDQLLAPIALYPDALLAQILMASTYPLEVVEAQRWVKKNPGLKEKALEDALQGQNWDPAVKSMANFPQILDMMNEKLDWTQKLGDAFLSQQAAVMDTVQSLRQKANAQGNLKSSSEQKIIVEQAPPDQPQTTIIKIEPTNPEVVYVPTYNPTVVYGPWWYPAYPPYYYYPPGYVAGGALFGFTAGVIVGAALWGNCNWGWGHGHGNVNINVNNYNRYNRTNISNNSWNHNSVHRKGVSYRDNATAQKFNQNNRAADRSRDNFRGRAESGRQELDKGAASDFRDKSVDRAGDRSFDKKSRDRQQSSFSGSDRSGDRSFDKSRLDRGNANRNSASNRGNGAFDGMNQGGSATRDFSDRGRSSRESMGSGKRNSGGSGFGGGGQARQSSGNRSFGGGGGGGHRGGGGRR